MKLLCLFVVLLLWQIKPLRAYTQKIPLLNYFMDYLEILLGRVKWFLSDTGLLAMVLIASFLFSMLGAFLGMGLISFVYECLVLWLVVCSLQKMAFPIITPEVALEQVRNHPVFAALPDSIWKINYYWVSPLFSYVFFGIFGLIFYWALCYMGQKIQANKQNLAHSIAEGAVWAPTRLLAFAYAIAGNFSKGLRVISEYFGADTHYNHYVLQLTVFVSIEDKPTESIAPFCARIQRDACILLLGIYTILVIFTWII